MFGKLAIVTYTTEKFEKVVGKLEKYIAENDINFFDACSRRVPLFQRNPKRNAFEYKTSSSTTVFDAAYGFCSSLDL